MRDDYLWDPSSKPDRDIEEIERRLRQFRYEPRELRGENWHGHSRRNVLLSVAAVAALALLSLGIWFALERHSGRGGQPRLPGKSADAGKTPDRSIPQGNPSQGGVILAGGPERPKARGVRPNQITGITIITVPGKLRRDASVSFKHQYIGQPVGAVANVIRPTQPVIDILTARHIEQAQVLLIAFKNSAADEHALGDVSYYRQRSRLMISSNVLLRHSAERTGNVPVERLLDSVEPFLLEIANLPDKPSRQDLGSIRDRINSDEIVVALGAYSSRLTDTTF